MSDFNSVIPLYTKALISEFENFGVFKKNRQILLVEGIDDNKVINKYKFYKDDHASSIEISISEGKRNALDHKEKLKKYDHRIACLLDYDYSPILGEASTDSNVFHYPYFELENLVMSDEILKKILNYYVDCSTPEIYNYFINEFEEYEKYFTHQIKVKLFIDINHRTKAIPLTSNQKKCLKNLSTVKISSIIKDNSARYRNMTSEEKLDLFYSEKLHEIGLTQNELDTVILSTCDPIFDYSKVPYTEEYVSKLKYFVDGKLLVSDLNEMIKHAYYNDRTLKELTLKTNPIKDINHSLMNDWIPTSKVFDEIFTGIEMYFKN